MGVIIKLLVTNSYMTAPCDITVHQFRSCICILSTSNLDKSSCCGPFEISFKTLIDGDAINTSI